MTDISSSRRYAQAIVTLADKHGDMEAWINDLAVLRQLWESAAARAYLEDVHISTMRRIERARGALGKNVSPLALNFLLLLVSRGRTFLIPFIARQFDDILRERTQHELVVVRSALPLSEAQRADLVQRLEAQTGKTITLEEAVDPEILGGLVLRVGDQLLDLSIAGRLRRLREQLVGRAV